MYQIMLGLNTLDSRDLERGKGDGGEMFEHKNMGWDRRAGGGCEVPLSLSIFSCALSYYSALAIYACSSSNIIYQLRAGLENARSLRQLFQDLSHGFSPLIAGTDSQFCHKVKERECSHASVSIIMD